MCGTRREGGVVGFVTRNSIFDTAAGKFIIPLAFKPNIYNNLRRYFHHNKESELT